MARYAVFIDGGYLKKTAAKALRRKGELSLDPGRLMEWIRQLNLSGHGDDVFFRAYWYDGCLPDNDPGYSPKRKYFDWLDSTPGLEVRLGLMAKRDPKWHHAVKKALEASGTSLVEFEKHFKWLPEYQQKGVDALITLDLVHHGDNHSYNWALLVAGDYDLLEAVWAVQDEGRHVALGVPTGGSIAPKLRRRADLLVDMDKELLGQMFPTISATAAEGR